MGARNDINEYGSVARMLHWIVFALIASMLALGLYFSELPKGEHKNTMMMLHASLGTLLIVLMIGRLLWRRRNVRPEHPAGSPAWQKPVATWLHRGLYLLVFLQMAVGVLISATVGRAQPFFGLFEIPVPAPQSDELHEWLEEVHELGWQIIAVAVSIHVLAALYHHFIAKDDVLRRMTVGIGRRTDH